MPNLPQKSSGGGGWRDQQHDRLVDYVKSLRPARGAGTRTQHTAHGVVRQSAAAVQARRTDFFLARITKLYNADFFGAMIFDEMAYVLAKDFVDNGADADAIATDPSLSHDEIITAKCLTSRKPESETIDGFDITYDYSDENNRTAQADMLGSEVQVCHPRYAVGNFIVLAKVQNGTKVLDAGQNQIFYMEYMPARFWCAAPDGYTPPE